MHILAYYLGVSFIPTPSCGAPPIWLHDAVATGAMSRCYEAACRQFGRFGISSRPTYFLHKLKVLSPVGASQSILCSPRAPVHKSPRGSKCVNVRYLLNTKITIPDMKTLDALHLGALDPWGIATSLLQDAASA